MKRRERKVIKDRKTDNEIPPGSSRDNNNFIRDIRNLEKVNRKENTKIKQRN